MTDTSCVHYSRDIPKCSRVDLRLITRKQATWISGSYGSLRIVFAIIWGGGLMRGEVQHMAVQKGRIWKQIHLHRTEHVYWTQHFTVWRGKKKVTLIQKDTVWVTQTYISGPSRHGSPPLSDKFVGVKTNLNDVVEQGEERSQRESCYKDGGEAKLKNCSGKNQSNVNAGVKNGECWTTACVCIDYFLLQKIKLL